MTLAFSPMTIEAESKIFVLPAGKTEYEFFNLNFRGARKTIVVSGADLFEIREVGPSSSFDARPEVKFPSGEPVKSFIFESSDGSPGFVKQSANVLTLSKFDIIFPTILSLEAHLTNKSERFKTEEDLLDDISASLGGESLHIAIQTSIVQALAKICETLDENGEKYYRVSQAKIMAVLDQKVKALLTLLLTGKAPALGAFIEESLGGVEAIAPRDIVELQTLRFSIDYVFDSYLSQDLKNMYYETCTVNFDQLDKFISERNLREKARVAVEENRAAITGNKRTANKASDKSKPSKKKAVKVAVGKGALDSFFGKK